MGGGRSQVETPQPVRMPNPNDQAMLAAKKMAAANAQKRGGRDSTILSQALSAINGSAGKLGA